MPPLPLPPPSRRLFCLVALLGAAQPGPAARAQAIGQGFELERAGQHARAAEVYFARLRADSSDIAALLGLERVLPSLNRLPELLPLVRRARRVDGANQALRALELRTYAGLNELDSAGAVARRWAAAAPGEEAPYREWAVALEDAHRADAAHDVLLAGRRALGRADAFAVELADLAQRAGDWEGAAREWGTAVSAQPAQLPNAAAQIADAPPERRDRIARLLTGDASPLTRRLGAELLLGWGDPPRAWAAFETTLTPPPADAVQALRHFADVAATRGTPDYKRVRARALLRFADLVPPELAVRARAEAARAYLDAGDHAAARPVLERIAADPTAPADAQAIAQAAVLEALIADGDLDTAAARLARAGARLGGDDRAALRLALVRARVRRGELALADSALAGDSSVDALALRGWVALYRGALQDAQQLFRQAGPYAGDRRDATERTAMLALLQQIPRDAFPELGRALLLVAQGDSGAAVGALRRAADDLGSEGGRPDVLLLAGRLAARRGAGGDGERVAAELFAETVRTGGLGAAAPAAELEWARLLLRQQRTADAVAHLEHLILGYPESAVVPQARRELERAKGAIPRS